MKLRRILLLLVPAGVALFAVTGCNTFRGVGQDLEQGGKQIQTWSDQR